MLVEEGNNLFRAFFRFKNNPTFALQNSVFDVIVPWCNGNTADFDSAFLGSNPSRTTNEPRLVIWRGFLLKKWQ